MYGGLAVASKSYGAPLACHFPILLLEQNSRFPFSAAPSWARSELASMIALPLSGA